MNPLPDRRIAHMNLPDSLSEWTFIAGYIVLGSFVGSIARELWNAYRSKQ